jgi:hypothetical protein
MFLKVHIIKSMNTKPKRIYVTMGVVPKAFTNAKKACENLWALEGPLASSMSEIGRDYMRTQFIKDGTKCLKKGGKVSPKWNETCPSIVPVEIY